MKNALARVCAVIDHQAIVGKFFLCGNALGGEQYLADPLGISCTVMTSDGFLVFGRRGPRVVFHAGFLHTFGGLLEPSDRDADGRYDVEGNSVTPVALIEREGKDCRESSGTTLRFFRTGTRVELDGQAQRRFETKPSSACPATFR